MIIPSCPDPPPAAPYWFALGFCQVIAGTPGRVVDLLISGDLKLERVVYFVLDEADRMLDGGFGDQMEAIADSVRPERQTVFFSATWPVPVRKLWHWLPWATASRER